MMPVETEHAFAVIDRHSSFMRNVTGKLILTKNEHKPLPSAVKSEFLFKVRVFILYLHPHSLPITINILFPETAGTRNPFSRELVKIGSSDDASRLSEDRFRHFRMQDTVFKFYIFQILFQDFLCLCISGMFPSLCMYTIGEAAKPFIPNLALENDT